MIGSFKHMCLYITSHLHWKALFKGEGPDASLSHPEKDLYIPCSIFLRLSSPRYQINEKKSLPQLKRSANMWKIEMRGPFRGDPKWKWSQQCPCGFLQNLFIKAAGISSWLTSSHYGFQVLQSFFLFLFSFLLLLLRAKYQSLENTGKIVCFSFCSFLRFLFANVLWVPHSLDIAWQLVIERSISLWPCLARNATSVLRFKACCWLARSPEHLCPLLMLQIQGKEAGNQHCQKQLRIWSHRSSYWSPSLGTSLAVQWLRLVFHWQRWRFDL